MGVHFFNVFKLAKVKIAEPHIPVSAAARVSKTSKKWRVHVKYQNIAKTLKNHKNKNKKGAPM